MCLPILIPDNRQTVWEYKQEITQRRFELMKKHGHNIYSEDHWKFFMEWYRNYYPKRKFYY